MLGGSPASVIRGPTTRSFFLIINKESKLINDYFTILSYKLVERQCITPIARLIDKVKITFCLNILTVT